MKSVIDQTLMSVSECSVLVVCEGCVDDRGEGCDVTSVGCGGN